MSLQPQHRPANQSPLVWVVLPPAPPATRSGTGAPRGLTWEGKETRRDGAVWQGRAYSVKQCAADTSHFSVRIAAPQKCSLFSRRLTCHGNSPLDASEPPTILAAVCMAGRLPQSEREERASASGSCWLHPSKALSGASGKSCFSFLCAPSTCSSSRTLPGMSQGRLGRRRLGKEHCKAPAHHSILPETSKARNSGDESLG